MSKYKIEFTKKAIKAYLNLPKVVQENIASKLGLLAKSPYDPNNNIKKLLGEYSGYRLRVGDYRVLYRIVSSELTIEIINIAHRKEAYQ